MKKLLLTALLVTNVLLAHYTDINISKIDLDGTKSPIAGAIITTLRADTGEVVDIGISDSNGHIHVSSQGKHPYISYVSHRGDDNLCEFGEIIIKTRADYEYKVGYTSDIFLFEYKCEGEEAEEVEDNETLPLSTYAELDADGCVVITTFIDENGDYIYQNTEVINGVVTCPTNGIDGVGGNDAETPISSLVSENKDGCLVITSFIDKNSDKVAQEGEVVNVETLCTKDGVDANCTTCVSSSCVGGYCDCEVAPDSGAVNSDGGGAGAFYVLFMFLLMLGTAAYFMTGRKGGNYA